MSALEFRRQSAPTRFRLLYGPIYSCCQGRSSARHDVRLQWYQWKACVCFRFDQQIAHRSWMGRPCVIDTLLSKHRFEKSIVLLFFVCRVHLPFFVYFLLAIIFIRILKILHVLFICRVSDCTALELMQNVKWDDCKAPFPPGPQDLFFT